MEDWSHMHKLPELFDMDTKSRILNFNKVLVDYKNNRLSQVSKKNQETFNKILKPELDFIVEFAQGKHPGKADEVLKKFKVYFDALE